MWHLEFPTSEDLTEYSNLLFNDLKEVIDNDIDYRNAFLKNGTIDNDLIQELLIAEPERLFLINQDVMSKIIQGYDHNELKEYHSTKSLQNKDAHQIHLYTKYHDKLNDLVDLVGYKKRISENKSRSYKLAKINNRNSCTYCNRQYTLFVIKDGGTNNNKRIIRPEFDHWFSKELYPLLSLSFYNLIPSCHICNSSVKGTKVFSIDTHVHPYLKKHNNLTFNFSRILKPNGWKLIIDRSQLLDSRVENMISSFKLDEIYDYHSDLELKDIMDFKMSDNETYLTTLFTTTLINLPQKTPQDAYRMLFGVEFMENKFLDRPFSKMKYDILKKEGLIKLI